MSKIHKTAIVSARASIGKNVSVGPYAIVGDCTIGARSIIHSHVVIENGVEIGNEVEVFPFTIVGKPPKGSGVTSRPIEYRRQIKIGDACSIGPHATVYFDVEIGRNCLLGDGVSIREKCRIEDRVLLSRYVTINYNTTIGSGTKIMDNTHITGNMIIGKNVFISDNVGTANDNRMRDGFGDHVLGPTIGDDVVIGVGANLLPGILIGKHATVAAGSLVTKDVEAHSLVAGVPSRRIK